MTHSRVKNSATPSSNYSAGNSDARWQRLYLGYFGIIFMVGSEGHRDNLGGGAA